QQIQHDAQADEKAEGILAEVEGLGGQELAALHDAGGQLFAQAAQVENAEVAQSLVNDGRQGVHDLPEVGGQVQLAGGNAAIQRGAFLDQRAGDQGEGKNDDEDTHRQGYQGGEVRMFRHARQQPFVQGHENDSQDGAPENGAEVGLQQPDEGKADQCQQQYECAEIKTVGFHPCSGIKSGP